MKVVGFTEVKERWRQGGKMVYWLFRKLEPDIRELDRFRKKTVLLEGNRNNFSILL